MADDNYLVKVNQNKTNALVDPSSGDGLYRIKIVNDELKTVVNPATGIEARVNEISLRVITTVSQGPSGISAYQVALNNGFVGTEEQWLSSLKVGLEPTIEDDDKILTNYNGVVKWQSIESKLNQSNILWDLGEIA